MGGPTHTTKPFKTLDEQVSLLKERKLIIKDAESAKRHLLEKNYFDLINGFETLLLKNTNGKNKEYDNIFFEDFLLLYEFDKELNQKILKLLDKIEIRLKTAIAYRFCEKYFINDSDSSCYIDASKFTDPRSNHLSLPRDIQFEMAKHKMLRSYKSNGNTTINYIQLCKEKYHFISSYASPPFWVTIKTLEFGSVFKLLLGLEKDLFEKVIEDMDMKYVDKQKFINSIRIFIELRNTCAHFQLVNRFRTSSKLRIDSGMTSDLSLRTKTNINGIPTYYEIRLFDVLLVLSQFEDLKTIRKLVNDFYFKHHRNKREKMIIRKLFERMGRVNYLDWMKIGL